MMQDDRLFVLLGKKLNDEATDEELTELAELLDNMQLQQHKLELLQELWKKRPAPAERLPDVKWDRLSARMQEQPGPESPGKQGLTMRGSFSRRFWWMAACIALLMIATVLWTTRPTAEQQQQLAAVTMDTVVYTPNGERKKIILPDSTRVQLNSGSKLVYNKKFASANRQVYLEGEAFFEVTKDAAHPFIVNTDRMLVKVLGTVFNVKSYDTNEDIETMVVEGKVEVSLKQETEKKVILLPREKISIKNNRLFKEKQQAQLKYEVETITPPVAKEKREVVPEEIAWTREKLVFTEEPFEMVALKMERWYNVHFHFENDKMKAILMSGDFDTVDIIQALQILQMLVDFSYEIKDKDIYINRRH